MKITRMEQACFLHPIEHPQDAVHIDLFSLGQRAQARVTRQQYVSHKQERPIQFVWQLRRPMPADFFRQAKVAAG